MSVEGDDPSYDSEEMNEDPEIISPLQFKDGNSAHNMSSFRQIDRRIFLKSAKIGSCVSQRGSAPPISEGYES